MIDLKTIFFAFFIIYFSLGISIFSTASSERESGLYNISFGNIILGLGYLFLIFSDIHFRHAFIWLGLMFTLIGTVFFYGALCQFLKIKIKLNLIFAVIAYNALGVWIFIDNDDLRLQLNSSSIIFVEGLFGYILVSHLKIIKGRGKYMLFTAFIVNIFALLLRAGFSIFSETTMHLFDQAGYQSVLYVSMLSTILYLSMGFTLMTKERTDYLNQELILKDSLTGLWNRRQLNKIGALEMSRNHRYGTPAALCLIDIDNFKQINDQYGHQRGDGILVAVSDACLAIIRDTDILGRWGGEEFLLIFPGTTMLEITRIAEKLRVAVNNIQIEPGKKVSISIGLSLCLSSDSCDSWFGRADAALYQAKSMGKNMAYLGFPTTLIGDKLLIKWGEEFETSDKNIDAEHRSMIVLVNDWITHYKEIGTTILVCVHLEELWKKFMSHLTRLDDFFEEIAGETLTYHHDRRQHLSQRFDFLMNQFKKKSISLEILSHFVVYELCVQTVLLHKATSKNWLSQR